MSAVNRRHFERYLVRRPIYIHTKDAMDPMGLLKEIGLGGLCVDYVILRGAREQKERSLYGTVVLDEGHLGKESCEFPYRLVYVKHLSSASPWGGRYYRLERLGMAFGELTELQLKQINQLIEMFR